MSNTSAKVFPFRPPPPADGIKEPSGADRSEAGDPLADLNSQSSENMLAGRRSNTPIIFEGDSSQSNELAKFLFRHGYVIVFRPARIKMRQKVDNALRAVLRWAARYRLGFLEYWAAK